MSEVNSRAFSGFDNETVCLTLGMKANQGGLKFSAGQIFIVTNDIDKYIICLDDQKNTCFETSPTFNLYKRKRKGERNLP